MPPFITALCPTWCRPDLLQTAVACWADQDYPRQSTALLIGDDDDTPFQAWDTATIARALDACPRRGDRKVVYDRFSPALSLPAKYNAMARRALEFWPQTELFAVWEDDDIYLPHHLRGMADCYDAYPLKSPMWTYPSWVYSDYKLGGTGGNYDRIPRENTGGRFHASIGVSVAAWEECPWPDTEQAQFDQAYIRQLGEMWTHQRPWAKWATAAYKGVATAAYIFRWHTGHLHGQSAMKSPEDQTWRRTAREAMRQQFLARGRDDDFHVEYDERAMWLIGLAEREAKPWKEPQ